MGHSHLDHAAMGHGGMDMGGPARCNMNMLFTWDTTNLCIVFRWWHIRTTGGLLFSLLAVVALTAAYEAIRSASRRYENLVARKTDAVPSKPASSIPPPRDQFTFVALSFMSVDEWEEMKAEMLRFCRGAVTETTPFLWTGRNQVEVSKRAHVIKALLYAVQTFYAFMLMLLFMTYNGWVMAAMGIGSFVGYLVFGNNTSATKASACH
ncbi:ctr copper transporter [Diplocarpon mali]|nr:ctr copper transporter [Diplocarpon mali]